jgi:hypothetical protein
MKSSHRLAVWLLAGLCTTCTAQLLLAADWQAPKDDLVTEKQLTNYFQVQKEAIDNWRAAGKAIEGSQSSATAVALALRNDEKFKASLATRNMTMDEYSWIGAKVWQAWAALQREQVIAEATKGIDQQKKTNEQKLADLKTKLAQYEKAQANGRRVMTKEDRESAIASAKSDEQSAADEAKQHGDDATAAHQEMTKAESDAATAENLAKNPPADVSADERAGYIDQKKSEAQSFRDAAKQAKAKEEDALKAKADSLAKAAAAHNRVANPDAPVTDDETAEIKKQNDEAIASTKSEITDTEQGLKLLNESAASLVKSFQQSDTDKAPRPNVELLRKHRIDFEQALGLAKPAAK